MLIASGFFLVSKKNQSKQHLYQLNGNTMGTYWVVKFTLDHNYPNEQLQLLHAAIEAELSQINKWYSTYITDSLISTFNKFDKKTAFKVNKDFIEQLILARNIWQQSDGFYDVTVGPLVNLWGFGPLKITKEPRADQISEVLNFVGMDKLAIDESMLTIKKSHPKLQLDLSSIAKGRAVDRLSLLLLNKYNLENTLVEIGGEVFARGYKAKNIYWSVGVEKPTVEKSNKDVLTVVPLVDLAIATSGDYRNFRQFNQLKVSHTINPKTGRPVKRDIISATVLMDNCTEADAYATAIMAMGKEAAIAMIEKYDLSVYLIYQTGESTSVYASEAWLNYLENAKREAL